MFYEADLQKDENHHSTVWINYHPMCESKIKIFNFIFWVGIVFEPVSVAYKEWLESNDSV